MDTQLIKKGLEGVVLGVKNLVLRSLSELLKPKWIWFEVIDRCNSHCNHCNIWQKKTIEKPLTLEEIEQTFKNPLFQEVECILNSGGEPTIREDIEKILLIEHKIFPKAKIHLSTNGLLPDRVIDVVKTMVKNNIPIEVGISLDGIGEKHDLVRGTKGNFEKVDWLLKELITMREKYNYKINPLIGFTLSDLTLNSFEEVKNYAQKMRVNFMAQWYNESPFYDNVGKNLVNKTLNKEKMIKIVNSLPYDILNEMWINWLKEKPIKFRCFAMYTFLVLRCNGDIIPCFNLWDNKVGNVRENNPIQIWHSLQAKNIRKLVKSCPGCLNSWSVGWSFASSFYPNLWFNLRHLNILWKKLRGKYYS